MMRLSRSRPNTTVLNGPLFRQGDERPATNWIREFSAR